MRIVVLGAGRVGSAIVRDLAAGGEFAVTAVDASAGRLARLEAVEGVATKVADLGSAAAVRLAVEGFDLVVGAVPGHMGFATVGAAITTGTPVVDISFFPEDARLLDEEARRRGVPVLVDCGIAPGCSNLVLGRMTAAYERVERFACHVGGLPRVRTLPWEYKAPFSPVDVIEEYTRPARYIRDGREVVEPALSGLEPVEFAGIGTLEAFNTDGLRTLLAVPGVPQMIEKTLRYPGTAERLRLLRDAGFFSSEPVDVGGRPVVPVELAAALLFPAWELGEGEEDLTAMRIVADAVDAGRPVRETFELVDRYDPVSGVSSMARTTGYTCTAMVRLVASGRWREPGVAAPEAVGRDEAAFEFVLAELARRGVVFTRTREAR